MFVFSIYPNLNLWKRLRLKKKELKTTYSWDIYTGLNGKCAQ